MESDLYTLVYFSRSTAAAIDGNLAAQVSEIMVSARLNNSKLGITGALLMTGGCFAQVLEGPITAVHTVFDAIREDPRHTGVTVLQRGPSTRRSFSDWSVAFASPDRWIPKGVDIEGILEDPACIDCNKLGQELITILQLLIAGSEVLHGPAPLSR